MTLRRLACARLETLKVASVGQIAPPVSPRRRLVCAQSLGKPRSVISSAQKDILPVKAIALWYLVKNLNANPLGRQGSAATRNSAYHMKVNVTPSALLDTKQ
jgi:hypothetical protein